MEKKEQFDEIMQDIQSKLADYLDSHPPLSEENAVRAAIAKEYGVPVSAVEVDLESKTAHIKMTVSCERIVLDFVIR